MKGKRIEGIVVKVTESTIVIMCHDGTFKNIPRSPEQIPRMGEPFSYIEREKRSRPSWSSYISVAAVFLMGILLYTLFLQAGPQASYVVAMDINPSMEVYVDQNDTVVKVVALNQDAEKVIKNIQLQHVALSQFLDDILSRSVEEGYLNKHTNGMVTTSIVPLDQNGQNINVDRISENIQDHMKQSLEKAGVYAQFTVTSDQQEILEEAHQMELSINKYKLYQRFAEKELDITLEEVRTESVSQLLELEKAKEDQLKQKENENQAAKPDSSVEEHTKDSANHKEQPASSSPSKNQSESAIPAQKQNNKDASTKKQERNAVDQGSQRVEKEQRKKRGSQGEQSEQTNSSPEAANNSEEQEKEDEQDKQNKLDKPDKSDKQDEQDETTNLTKQSDQSVETTEQEEEQTEQTEQDEQTSRKEQEEDQQNQQEEEEPQEEDLPSEQEQDQSEGTTSENSSNVEGGSPPTNQGETSGRP
jgi:hypothetical protein